MKYNCHVDGASFGGRSSDLRGAFPLAMATLGVEGSTLLRGLCPSPKTVDAPEVLVRFFFRIVASGSVSNSVSNSIPTPDPKSYSRGSFFADATAFNASVPPRWLYVRILPAARSTLACGGALAGIGKAKRLLGLYVRLEGEDGARVGEREERDLERECE